MQPSDIPDPPLCPHCLADIPASSSFATHLLSCELVPVNCPYAPYGCPIRLPRAQLQQIHLSAEAEEQPCAFQPLREFLGTVDRLEDENRVLRTRCEALEEGMREMRAMMEAVTKGMGGFFVPPASLADGVLDAGLPSERHSIASAPSTTPAAPRPGSSPLSPTVDDYFNSPAIAGPSTPTPLPALLASHQSTLASLTTSLSTLDSRHTQARTEATHALGSEIHDLRQGLLGVRSQVMHLYVEQARRDVLRGGFGRVGGPSMRVDGEEGGEGGSSSDEEGGYHPIGSSFSYSGPGMVGMPGMGAGPRFGTPFYGPHGRPYLPMGMAGGMKL